MAQGVAAEVRLRARRPRSRDGAGPEGARPRQPDAPRRHGAARLRLGAEPGDRRGFTAGSGRLELARTIVAPADRDARDRQPDLEGTLRHRAGQHAEQLRHERRAAEPSRAARSPGAVLRRSRLFGEGAAPRDPAQPRLSAEHRHRGRRGGEGLRQSPLLAGEPPPPAGRADSRRGADRCRARSMRASAVRRCR